MHIVNHFLRPTKITYSFFLTFSLLCGDQPNSEVTIFLQKFSHTQKNITFTHNSLEKKTACFRQKIFPYKNYNHVCVRRVITFSLFGNHLQRHGSKQKCWSFYKSDKTGHLHKIKCTNIYGFKKNSFFSLFPPVCLHILWQFKLLVMSCHNCFSVYFFAWLLQW